MTRADMVRAAIAACEAEGIQLSRLNAVEFRNCGPDSAELTVAPGASSPWVKCFCGLCSDHVAPRSSKPVTLTIEG